MKIALVVPGGVDRSGTQRVIPVLLGLIERLVRAGDEVHVFALAQEPEPGEWQLLGATICNAGRAPRRLRSILSLWRKHRHNRFDAVHAFWAGAPAQVATAFGALSGTPVLVTLPGGDLTRLPAISYGAMLRRRSRIATKLVLSRASAILVPSESTAAQARSKGFRPITCPFGVALDRWPPAGPQRREGRAPLRLIHVASRNWVKNPFGLLDAMRQLADRGIAFHLTMIGEDTLGGEVERHCSSLALDEHVTFRGFVPNEELRSCFDDADLLVMNSLHEGGPIAMIEAAAAGVPTVGTDVGSIADWAPDAAVAVPLNDPPALADAIAALAADEDERLRLASAAYARAIARDADSYAAEVRSIYARLAKRR
jgi:glycosyltransferase involved in cell wall biosynthesis